MLAGASGSSIHNNVQATDPLFAHIFAIDFMKPPKKLNIILHILSQFYN